MAEHASDVSKANQTSQLYVLFGENKHSLLLDSNLFTLNNMPNVYITSAHDIKENESLDLFIKFMINSGKVIHRNSKHISGLKLYSPDWLAVKLVNHSQRLICYRLSCGPTHVFVPVELVTHNRYQHYIYTDESNVVPHGFSGRLLLAEEDPAYVPILSAHEKFV